MRRITQAVFGAFGKARHKSSARTQKSMTWKPLSASKWTTAYWDVPEGNWPKTAPERKPKNCSDQRPASDVEEKKMTPIQATTNQIRASGRLKFKVKRATKQRKWELGEVVPATRG